MRPDGRAVPRVATLLGEVVADHLLRELVERGKGVEFVHLNQTRLRVVNWATRYGNDTEWQGVCHNMHSTGQTVSVTRLRLYYGRYYDS